MRLLVYNIRYGAGVRGDFHFPLPFLGYLRNTRHNLEKITDFIKSYHPDIVGLIEIDSGSYRCGMINQAEAIAKAMDHFHVFQSKYSSTSIIGKLPLFNQQANALLTSSAIRTPRFHYFQYGVKRLVIELELDHVTIFLVHLSIKFRHRQNQLNHLYSLVKEAKKPVIVAGDFNPLWGAREMDLFLAATGLIILYGADIHINHFEIPRITLSDHLPLICDFDVKNGT